MPMNRWLHLSSSLWRNHICRDLFRKRINEKNSFDSNKYLNSISCWMVCKIHIVTADFLIFGRNRGEEEGENQQIQTHNFWIRFILNNNYHQNFHLDEEAENNFHDFFGFSNLRKYISVIVFFLPENISQCLKLNKPLWNLPIIKKPLCSFAIQITWLVSLCNGKTG